VKHEMELYPGYLQDHFNIHKLRWTYFLFPKSPLV